MFTAPCPHSARVGGRKARGMSNLEAADSALTESRRKRAAALKGGGPKARRSSISNGRTLPPTADGNSIWARLVRDTLVNLVSHCGGAGVISETQKLAARRVSVLESELIHLEDRIALARQCGDEPDQNTIELYGRLADRQRRLSDPLGWRRTAREVGMSIGDLMRAVAVSPPQSAEDGSVFEDGAGRERRTGDRGCGA
jgi:hypothetical protein